MNKSSPNSLGADAAKAPAGRSFAFPSESDRRVVAVGGTAEPPRAGRRGPRLSIKQELAMQALIAGENLDAAAALANVDPSTLYRWRTRDQRFIAALDGWREQIHESTVDRILTANDFAVTTVLNACRKGDIRTSLMVLKNLGPTSRRGKQPMHRLTIRGDADGKPARGAESADVAGASAEQNAGDREADLERLEGLLEGVDLDDETRRACLTAFSRHRALLESRINSSAENVDAAGDDAPGVEADVCADHAADAASNLPLSPSPDLAVVPPSMNLTVSPSPDLSVSASLSLPISQSPDLSVSASFDLPVPPSGELEVTPVVPTPHIPQLCVMTIEKIGNNRLLVIAKLAEFLGAPRVGVEHWLNELPLKIGRRFDFESASRMLAVLQEVGATASLERVAQ